MYLARSSKSLILVQIMFLRFLPVISHIFSRVCVFDGWEFLSLVSLIFLVLLADARLHRWRVVPPVRFSLKEFKRQRATRRVRARVHFVESPAGSSRPQGTVYPQRPPGVHLPPADTRLVRARAAPAFYPRRPPGFWPLREARRGPTAVSNNRSARAPFLWPSGPKRRAGPHIWAFL